MNEGWRFSDTVVTRHGRSVFIINYATKQRGIIQMRPRNIGDDNTEQTALFCNGSTKGKPTAARDVPAGQPWVFPDHRSMAEVIAEERRARGTGHRLR
jgi:hypothetical protein